MKHSIAAILSVFVLAWAAQAQTKPGAPSVKADDYPIADGPFKPTWESLGQYKCPDWFRDAKLGIWAVWGPEAVPQQGDWYARNMYIEGSGQYKYHLAHYGHPSKFGYKDIIPLWKAQKWDPDALTARYKKAGAKYFCVIANHHDNFDCWDSKFHKWNSVNMGPKRDIVGEWKKAADKYGLRFGVTEHLGASWSWFGVSKGTDKNGALAGVPYDGNDRKYEDLYHWGNKDASGWYASNTPESWKKEWFNRIKDLVDNYQPDLLYSDGGIPYEEVGRRIVAHFYNRNIKQHGGQLQAVYNCKGGGCGYVLDLERGIQGEINRHPWQTDTCVGGWYYHKGIGYKTPGLVIGMLADIVSKNGNLLLNFPPRPDGTLDEAELKILDEMAAWMAVNGEAIFATRPFKVYGEGAAKVPGGGFNEGQLKYTAGDIRFTTKGDVLFAICLGVPDATVAIRCLGRSTPIVEGEVADVRLLGHEGKIEWSRTADALTVKLPADKPCRHALALKITGLRDIQWDDSVLPGADGSLKLPPAQAELHGTKIRVETRGGHPSIGFWDSPEEWVSWDKVKFAKAGTYEITAETSTAAGPTEYMVEVAGQKAAVKTPKTANWDEFKSYVVGTVRISQPGVHAVSVRAKAQGWKPMGLAWLEFRPRQAVQERE